MTEMPNNYDKIAGLYDFLSRLVFGQAQVNAQVDLLPHVATGSRILVVGGGTGWILEKLTAMHPSGLRITYVEISANMIALAKKRKAGDNEVLFVHAPVEQFVTSERYDTILTAFLFDNFSPERAAAVFSLLDGLLNKEGNWLFTDFVYRKEQGRLWQGLLLKIMYWFFGRLCKVEGKHLVDTTPLFTAAGYRQMYTAFRYWGFIKSIVYRKTNGR